MPAEARAGGIAPCGSLGKRFEAGLHLRHEFAAAYLTKRSILLGRGAAGEGARCLGEAFRPVANLRRNRPCLDFCRCPGGRILAAWSTEERREGKGGVSTWRSGW